jgi:hypothetical protein
MSSGWNCAIVRFNYPPLASNVDYPQSSDLMSVELKARLRNFVTIVLFSHTQEYLSNENGMYYNVR